MVQEMAAFCTTESAAAPPPAALDQDAGTAATPPSLTDTSSVSPFVRARANSEELLLDERSMQAFLADFDGLGSPSARHVTIEPETTSGLPTRPDLDSVRYFRANVPEGRAEAGAFSSIHLNLRKQQSKDNEELGFEVRQLAPSSGKRTTAIGTIKRRKMEMEKLRAMEKQLLAKLKEAKLAANLSSSSASSEASTEPKASEIGSTSKNAEKAMKTPAEVENRRLRDALEYQLRLTRSLRRLLQRRMCHKTLKNAVIFYKRYCLLETPQVNPSVDNDAVFNGLMVGLDELYAGVGRFFEKVKMQELLCPGRRNLRPARKLGDQVFVELLDRYDVPFDLQRTASAVWKCLGERDLETRRRKHLFATHLDASSSTMLSSFSVTFQHNDVDFLIQHRRITRKYTDQERTVFVSRTFIEPMGYPASVAFYETQRLIVTEKASSSSSELGPTTMILSHLQATGHDIDQPDGQRWRAFPRHEIGVAAWDAAKTYFNHRVEDVLVQPGV